MQSKVFKSKALLSGKRIAELQESSSNLNIIWYNQSNGLNPTTVLHLTRGRVRINLLDQLVIERVNELDSSVYRYDS